MFFQQPCLVLWLTSLADATTGSAGRQIFLGLFWVHGAVSLLRVLTWIPFSLNHTFFFFFWKTTFVDKIPNMKTHDMAKIFPYFRVLANVSV